MVWWIDSDRYCYCRSKFFHFKTSVDVINDRIFQTANIMYDLNKSNYDIYEIHCLTKSGVNIFNVDRTIHGEDFFKKIKELIINSKNLLEIFPENYRSPISLAITTTVTQSVDIDECVDIIILKDVKKSNELLDFKKKLKNTSIPVLLWMKSWSMEDLYSLIQFSDGVLIDMMINSTEEFYLEILHVCKQACKSVFFVIDDIIKDYRLLPADEMRVLAIANKIIKHQFDGVMLYGSCDDEDNESQLVRSVVRAVDVTENETIHDYYKLSFTIKTPVLPWISTSLAASLAAKQSGASAIIVLTTTGTSARWIANASTPCHIIALTTRKSTARRLHLYRKVIPVVYKQTYAANWSAECWNRVVYGTTVALQSGLCSYGTKAVVLAPSDKDIRYCNSLRVISIPLMQEDLSC